MFDTKHGLLSILFARFLRLFQVVTAETLFTFNSLCEIPLFLSKQNHKPLFTFNSLCEILRRRGLWLLRLPVFPFNSLCEIQPFGFFLPCFSNLFFQFSLRDSPVITTAWPLVRVGNFQFSLRDSLQRFMPSSCKKKTTFNSLCEIQVVRLPRVREVYGLKKTTFNSLCEILHSCWRWNASQLLDFQFSLRDSGGILGLIAMRRKHFQFSLRDSTCLHRHRQHPHF